MQFSPYDNHTYETVYTVHRGCTNYRIGHNTDCNSVQ